MDVGLTEVTGTMWWNSERNSLKLKVMAFTFYMEPKRVIVFNAACGKMNKIH